MDRIGFAVDSSADFPPGVAKQLGLHILPVHIFVDGSDHLHGIDIGNEQMIEHLKARRDIFTKPFYPGECADFFERLAPDYDRIFSFHVSTHLSGCYSSAKGALKLLSAETAAKIEVIDTGCASISQGLFVETVVTHLRQGNTRASLAPLLDAARRNISMWFSVDNLYWLKRSGRLNFLTAFVGGMLDLKPIVTLKDGKLVPLEKHRGTQAAVTKMIQHAVDKGMVSDVDGRIWVAHADAAGAALHTREILANGLGKDIDEIEVVPVGPTIAAHTGPGSLCLAMEHRRL
jgi:DegV family protein with EDD domain